MRRALRWGGALLAATLVLLAGRAWIDRSYQAALVQSAQRLGQTLYQDLRARRVSGNRDHIQTLLDDAAGLSARLRVLVIGPAAPVACIDCHSGAGVLGRTGALKEGAVNVVKFASGHYQRPRAAPPPPGRRPAPEVPRLGDGR